jgi:staphylococcal nuclease domain-containing protein 1
LLKIQLKKQKKKIWENYDEQAEEEKRRQKSEEFNEKNKLKKPEIINVVVTEIIDATKFYIQIINKETEQLEELMKNLSIVDDNNESYKPKIGELVKAQFSVDNEWYRAKVLEEVDGEYSIIYIDYGNMETIPSNKIRKLHPNFNTQKLRPQAYEAQLAYIIPPKLSDDYGLEAAELLKELVWDKKLVATVEYKENVGTENEKLFLSLGNHESENYVNCALLRNGLAKVEKVKSKYLKSIIEKLKEEEEKAKSEHLSIWEYGDPGSDEDEPKKKKK